MMEIKYIFEGKVQGVNFRKTTKELADQLSIKGYVKNQVDGSVLLLAQGNQEDISQLIQTLHEKFNISKFTETPKVISKLYTTFSIEY